MMQLLIYACTARRLAALALCCALAACATHEEPPPTYQAAIHTPVAAASPQLVALYIPTPVPVRDDEVTPLDYYEWARSARSEELYAEQVRLSAPGPDANAIVDKVQLGILLGVSALASRESEGDALAMLESIDAANVDDASRDYAVFAGFLLDHLEQREELREATSNVVTSREELEALQRSNAQLQQKIDALTRLEEQLIEREQAQDEQAAGQIEPGQTERDQ